MTPEERAIASAVWDETHDPVKLFAMINDWHDAHTIPHIRRMLQFTENCRYQYLIRCAQLPANDLRHLNFSIASICLADGGELASYSTNLLHTTALNWVRYPQLENPVFSSSLVAGFLHCIFCNPYEPLRFEEHWRTSTVLDLAHTIYDTTPCHKCSTIGVFKPDCDCKGSGITALDFSRMPFLADALMDAGCDDQRILDHCTAHHPAHWPPAIADPYPHAVGCHVIELIKGTYESAHRTRNQQ